MKLPILFYTVQEASKYVEDYRGIPPIIRIFMGACNILTFQLLLLLILIPAYVIRNTHFSGFALAIFGLIYLIHSITVSIPRYNYFTVWGFHIFKYLIVVK